MKKLLFAFFLFIGLNGYTQLSKKHYIAPIAGTQVSDQALYISTPSTGYINVIIKPIGGDRTDWIIKSIKNDDPWEFQVGSGNNTRLMKGINSLNGKFDNAGYIVESEGLTYVSYRFNSPESIWGGDTFKFHSAAYVSKGESALGSRFRVATFTNTPRNTVCIEYNIPGDETSGCKTFDDVGNSQHFISILATEDDTRVTLSDFENGIEFTNLDISGPQFGSTDVLLDKNETYIFGFEIDTNDSNEIKQALIGALVVSEDSSGSGLEKPIVVTSGSVGGSFRNQNIGNTDYGLDQLTDISILGNEYIFVRGAGLDEVEKIILIADKDGTEIYKDGGTFLKTLNKGEHLILDADTRSIGYGEFTGDNLYISTQDPSFKLIAFQGIGYVGGANQGLVFVPPLSCSSKGNIDNIPFIEKVATENMIGGTLTILTEDGADLRIYRNNNLIADSSGSSGVYNLSSDEKNVNGKPGYKTYFLLSDPSSGLDLTGNISVRSDKELYLASSTYSEFGSAGSFYSGFVTEPQVVPELTISPLGTCINSSINSNVKFKTANSFDAYQWEIFDEITNSWINAPSGSSQPNNEADYTPTVQGKYRLIGTLSCFPTKQYISEIQRVNICPTDFDSDGIVDNVDLDLDNDGILNKIESLGDFEIDLSNISQPVLKLPTNITTKAKYNNNDAPNGTFNGFSDGKFESEIKASGINETALYTINPLGNVTQRKLNINIEEVLSSTAIAEAEFKIRVFPDEKNITLLDPGEKLLVNNGGGFVSVPSEGISGNEIIFKYKTDASLILDPLKQYNFFAYQIDGIEFTHKTSSIGSVDSKFEAKLSIIDFDLDTNSDGELDMFDKDSDGDGCFDIIESDSNFDNTLIRPREDRDINNDGVYGDLIYGAAGNEVIQFPDVDLRGRIVNLIDTSTETYQLPPADPLTGNFLFLDNSAPDVIITDPPINFQACENGDRAEFSLTVDPGGYTPYYQWQVNKQAGNGWEDLRDDPNTTPLTIDATLEILNVDDSMDGWQYRAITYTDGALCEVISAAATLNVESALPVAKPVDFSDPLLDKDWIVKCDEGSNEYDGISTFNLKLLDDYILDGLDNSKYEVSYFLDQTKSLDPNETGITSSNNYNNTPTGYDPSNPTVQTTTIHVRLKNIATQCLATPTSFEITVNPKPILNVLPDIEQDNTVFNLNNLRADLSANFASETFEFYDSSGVLITSPDNYTFTGTTGSNEETINVISYNTSTLGNGCSQTASFTIRLGACDIPTTFPVIEEPVCETSTDPLGGGQDGFETFDKTIFSDIEADLITAEPLFNVFGTEITFYRSDAQATVGAVADRIDKTVDYTTSAGDGFVEYSDRWEQELWVRVENTTFTSACFDTKLVGKLIINKLPELKVLSYGFNQCNNPLFNLTTLEDDLANSHGSLSFNWKDSNGNPIANPIQYQIPGGSLTETVTVEIETNPSIGSSCISPTIISVDLAWFGRDTAPPTYIQKEVHKVSSTGALTGQGQNGIESFDATIFSDIITNLTLAEPTYVNKQFAFYGSQNNALIDDDVFDTNNYMTEPGKEGFTYNATENRWEQEIWVYISNDITTAITTCFGLYQVGTLYIEKRPVFYDVADQELCDDAPDELDTYSVFDTSLLFDEFTINPSATLQQDPSLFDVQYSYIDDSGSAVVLDPNLPVNFNSNTQDVTVTLTNKNTNSSSPAGQSEGIIKFRVYKQPVTYSDPSSPGIFTIEDCDDVASGADDDGETLFDITNIKDILLTDPSGTRPVQLSSDFDFVFTDGSGNPVTLTSDYRAKSGDQINVTITNPLSTLPNSCEETITIEFKVNPLPSYDMDDDTIVCLNPLPGQPVEIGTSNWNGGTDPLIYEYSWTFSGDPLFSENTPTIGVEKGGVYTVVVTDAVTRCTRTKTITVTESEMASLDRDDDGNVDLTEYNYFVEKTDLTDDNTNTITIKNIADLGIGDYEFSIDDPFGPYQDDPTFENVKPGVHTIYIRDKNSYYTYDYGCGIAQVDVSIIGYKKYFTPNGDGINETWKILGINSAFNAKSKVYIFDRYGKLLKQLDPLSDGWDGTYLGKPMPATDYWFRTYLEDGREFKGHFSLVRGKF